MSNSLTPEEREWCVQMVRREGFKFWLYGFFTGISVITFIWFIIAHLDI